AWAPGGPARLAFGDGSGHVARTFVDRARDLAGRGVGAAARLQQTAVAIVFAGAIEQCRAVQGALAGEHLAAGAEVDIALMVVGEVVAREGPIGSERICRTRTQGFDAVLVD